jgi:hypothetical protein
MREYLLQIWDGGWVDCDAPVSGSTTVLRTHRFEPVKTNPPARALHERFQPAADVRAHRRDRGLRAAGPGLRLKS